MLSPISDMFSLQRSKDETVALQAALAEAQSKLGDAEDRVKTMQSRLEAGRDQVNSLEASIATLAEEKSRLEGTQKEQACCALP